MNEMIVNTVLNGSWFFYPSLLDFIFMVFITLFTEISIVGIFCYSIKMKEDNVSVVLSGVIIANMVSALIGYVVLFSVFGGW